MDLRDEIDDEVWSTSQDRGARIAELKRLREGQTWTLVVHSESGSGEIILGRKDMKDLYEAIESERYGGPTLPTSA